MKSNFNILRVLLLLLLFLDYYVEANALSSNSDINPDSVYFQHVTGVKAKPQNSEVNRQDNKNATPVIILKVLPYQGKIAQLSWTSSDYSVPGTYYVERLDPSGWVVLKQLPYDALREYNDTISFPYCKNNSNITYQIRFISALDNTTSSPENVSLYDQTSPAEVQNLGVTITQTSSPLLTWTPVSGDSIFGYRIQRYNGYSWDSITTVNSNSYIDQNVLLACDSSYKYVVSTIDKCGISSDQLLYEDFAVQTIKLDPSQPGQCDKFSNLVWNSYINMPGGLGGYTIYRSDNGSVPVLIGDISNNSFTDNFNFVDGHTYFYTVQAHNIDYSYSSSSCQVGWPYSGAILPDTVYIPQVSVENDRYIRVDYHLFPAGSVVDLILERSDDGGTNFHAVDTLAFSGASVPQDFYFIDSLVDVHHQSYYYRLEAIDNCGYLTPSMNMSHSILLQGSTDQIQNTLNWNSYETWTLGVEGYKVYRILDEDPATIEMIGTTDQSTFSFVDLLSGVDPTKAVCYWVVANEISTSAISQSNTFCVSKEPLLFMPNAFYPDGINHLLRPVPKPAFVDVQSFKMTVFSRWGQQLFETTDITTGWNGIINGQNAPAGLYTYLLTYKSLEGKEYTKRGTAALIK